MILRNGMIIGVYVADCIREFKSGRSSVGTPFPTSLEEIPNRFLYSISHGRSREGLDTIGDLGHSSRVALLCVRELIHPDLQAAITISARDHVNHGHLLTSPAVQASDQTSDAVVATPSCLCNSGGWYRGVRCVDQISPSLQDDPKSLMTAVPLSVISTLLFYALRLV